MTPTILFAPGSTERSDSDWMKAWAGRLGTIGEVKVFDYPFSNPVPCTYPEQVEVLALHHHAEAKKVGRPLVLAGKSMGAHVSVHVALRLEAEGDPPLCVLSLGYPLHSAKVRSLTREKPLLALRSPILFLVGSRDVFCPVEELVVVRNAMTARSTLHVVEGAAHSLTPADSKLWERENSKAVQAISDFVGSLV